MRTSRIMAILLCLCFTFAAASTLWADKDFEAEGRSGKKVKIKISDDNRLLRVKVQDGTNPEEDVTNDANERHGDDVRDLRIKRRHGPEEIIQSVSEGTIIYSGTNSCVWYFSGGWHQYCW